MLHACRRITKIALKKSVVHFGDEKSKPQYEYWVVVGGSPKFVNFFQQDSGS